ncbi:MAG TPA: hypothetical protein VHW00_15305 [Thermoanaerobaculia bacterium]|nr:hypothetical protein [Thermoanaerobaculia bacterium]
MKSLAMLSGDVRMSELLPWCMLHRKADRVLVIARADSARKRRVLIEPEVDRSVQRELGASILRMAWVEAWPVVQLVKHVAKAYVLQLDDRLIREMVRTQDRFFGWNVSNRSALPEDCCIYRPGDPLPIVMSRTHTRDAWLLTDKGPHFPGAIEVPWDEELLAYVPRTDDFIQEIAASR